jgi:NADPH:quinone reductase-like Zn-dependent oxidoreductase
VSRAVVIERSGGPEVLELTRVPSRPLGRSQVRVAVEAAGVNLVDAENRADPTWAGLVAPYVVGYEFAGRVEEVGELVDDLDVDEEVWGLLPVRGTRWGAYAEEVVADARFVAVRPPSLGATEAAALPLAGVTALQLLDRLDPAPDEWILVHGAAGGVGHLFVQLAHARGALVAAPASAARHELLHGLGVRVVVDRNEPGAIEAAREEAGTDFAMVADLVGHGTLAASLDVIAEGGRAGSIVELAGDLEEAVDRNVTLHGVLLRPGRDVLSTLGELAEAGTVRPVLDEVRELEQAQHAHRRVETGSGQGKVVLTIAPAERDPESGR